MTKLDPQELELLEAFEKGQLTPVATKAELARLKAAALATGNKDKRINIRLSSIDLGDLQARALQEGMPYQTLIASIVHKYVTGQLEEKPAPTQRSGHPAKRRSPSDS